MILIIIIKIEIKKVLIVFDDMIADIEYNKNFKRIIKELFYRARKINVLIVSGHLDYKDFLKMCNYCTEEPYSFMTIDARPTATIPF